MTFQINTYNLEQSGDLEENTPEFAEIKPSYDLDKIDKEFDHLIVIGNGGSITSLRALYYTFIDEADKKLDILSTMDPDRLHQINSRTKPENTLIMPISKSGTTIGVLESLTYFIDKEYDFIPLTTSGSPLHEIAKKHDQRIIEHQEVGGRFSGLTNTALAPAEMIGLHSDEIRKGGEEAYEQMKSEATKLAKLLYDAEQKGFEQVLTPFYSSRMFVFYPLMVQLIHETVCKEGKGQTFFGDHAPEYQHHTNQRLFGGKDNIIPFFFRTTHRHEKIQVPDKIADIEVKGKPFGELDQENLSDALHSEFSGVKHALEDENRPYIDLKLENPGYSGFGGLMAFMQLLAYYSAEIRGVDPLTQPDVEKSKEIGLEERYR